MTAPVVPLTSAEAGIDIMTSISGVGFDEARPGGLIETLFEVPVVFLGRDAFIMNKRASGRPKDLAGVRSLEG